MCAALNQEAVACDLRWSRPTLRAESADSSFEPFRYRPETNRSADAKGAQGSLLIFRASSQRVILPSKLSNSSKCRLVLSEYVSSPCRVRTPSCVVKIGDTAVWKRCESRPPPLSSHIARAGSSSDTASVFLTGSASDCPRPLDIGAGRPTAAVWSDDGVHQPLALTTQPIDADLDHIAPSQVRESARQSDALGRSGVDEVAGFEHKVLR